MWANSQGRVDIGLHEVLATRLALATNALTSTELSGGVQRQCRIALTPVVSDTVILLHNQRRNIPLLEARGNIQAVLASADWLRG